LQQTSGKDSQCVYIRRTKLARKLEGMQKLATTYTILVETPERKRRKWEDNIKIDHRYVVSAC
jgi:hypothetical protein